LEDSLAFFQETHEEQDVAYQAALRQKEEAHIKLRWYALDQADKKGRAEIDAVIQEMLREKQIGTVASLEKYKQLAGNEEKEAMFKLRKDVNGKLQKIKNGVMEFRRKQQKEYEQTLEKYREQAKQRGQPMSQQEWMSAQHQLQERQQPQLQALQAKSEEYQKQLQVTYRNKADEIQKNYEQKLADIESGKQKLFAKMHSNFQQMRQRYLKRHLQKITRERNELLQRSASNQPQAAATTTTTKQPHVMTPREMAKYTLEEKGVELNPPNPIVSRPPWALELDAAAAAGAGQRHKHRKGVMSQVSRQLTVEIHNEGVWISSAEERMDKKIEFLPWGPKAYSFLESVVCGEMPPAYSSFATPESIEQQGGQIRCILMDLRTSEETASVARAEAARQYEESILTDLEKKVHQLNEVVLQADEKTNRSLEKEKQETAVVEQAMNELEKTNQVFEKFKEKFRNFLDAGTCERYFLGRLRSRFG
jgi:hypothetical protein